MENSGHGGQRARSRFPDGFRILRGSREYVTYTENASVRVWYSETPWTFESHYHSAVEIIMPIRGEVIYTVSEFSYRVQANEVLIVPPDWEHSLTMHEGSARYLMLFEPDSIFQLRDMHLIRDLLRIPIYISAQPEAQEAIRSLLMQVVSCYEKKDYLWNAMCYSLFTQMYVRLGQLNLLSGLRRSAVRGVDSDTEIIDSARLYIDENYMHGITLADLSAFTGFTSCYFSRIFKRQCGVTFSEYLRQRRVNAAAEMLIHSHRTIQDIAESAGFGSIATFNRVFRETKNCTPTQFRGIYGTEE